MESLCFSLYDMLRPVIIHTHHLETLADLTTIFKVIPSCYPFLYLPTPFLCVQVEMLEERVEPKGLCYLIASKAL